MIDTTLKSPGPQLKGGKTMNKSGKTQIDNAPRKPDLKPEVRLAVEHWEWIGRLLRKEAIEEKLNIETAEYLYKTAFIHGWKHAKK